MISKNILDGPSFESYSRPKKLALLLHGYGDNGENFIPLARYLYDSSLQINFFSPNAPLSVTQSPGGRQWFNPYPNGVHFMDAGQKEKEIMKQECLNSLNLLKDYINELCSQYHLDYQDCFIIGFSQGAMLAFELGKYLNQSFAGCVMLSGRILSSKKMENSFFVKTPLMVVHGDQDEIIQPHYFFQTCHIVKKAGFVFEEHLIKNEGHIVSIKILKLIQNFIKKNI